MRKHYSDLSLVVKPTEKGLRVVMTGRTPAAVKVAQNHAQIVSKFAAQGWSEHDVRHPAVASATAPEKPATGPAAGEGCQSEAKCGKKCPNPAAPK
jgi:hypothetical protein